MHLPLANHADADNAGTPIPIPADFPVEWDDDIEPTLLWGWDDFHSPLPRTPMTASAGEITTAGSKMLAKKAGTYRPGGRSKVINGYPFSASTAPPFTDDEKAEREAKLDREIEKVRENWDNEWLPELKADLAEMKAVSYSTLDAGALWKTIERALQLNIRHWQIHHFVVLPVIAQSERLEKISSKLLELIGETSKSSAHILLHGVETLTVQSIKILEALARDAGERPEVRSVLERDISADETLAALNETAAGREWRSGLDEYLHDFGYRCTGFDLSFPTWVEDQSFAFQIIRGLLDAGESGAAADAERERALDAERDALLVKIREAGKSDPKLLAEFDRAYELGQQVWPLKEDHSHYIDQGSTAIVRIAIAEMGRRLEASGAISHADDIWYITLGEASLALNGNPIENTMLEGSVKEALLAQLSGYAPVDLHKLVVERRAERQRFSKLTPPKHLGTYPPDYEDEEESDSEAESAGTLRGVAASSGEASGIARVVLSPDDFHKVRKGDVLVCRSTAPMWTPLFRVISALVSESGGILSHPAVVAREFKLPAVVGVPRATGLIADGQPITVSGSDGLVHTG
jgi:pyruvate,water dikinase